MSSIYFNDIEAAKIAINLERTGISFYTQAAARSKEPNVKRVFEDLAQAERQHLAHFEQLEQTLLEEPHNSNYLDAEEIDGYMARLVETHVFSDEGTAKQLLDQVDNDIAVLGLAMRAERDTLLFYQEMSDFTDSKAAQEAFRQIIDEERRHLVILAERSDACENLRG